MYIPVTGVLMKINDEAGRPLIILKRMKSGKINYVFFRYNDMTTSDKDKIIRLCRFAAKNGAKFDDGESPESIEMFLSFSENRLCG